MEDMHKYIERCFTYHASHGDQQDRYWKIREKGKEFALLIEKLTLCSREQTHALNKVREAVMWANAAIACNEVCECHPKPPCHPNPVPPCPPEPEKCPPKPCPPKHEHCDKCGKEIER